MLMNATAEEPEAQSYVADRGGLRSSRADTRTPVPPWPHASTMIQWRQPSARDRQQPRKNANFASGDLSEDRKSSETSARNRVKIDRFSIIHIERIGQLAKIKLDVNEIVRLIGRCMRSAAPVSTIRSAIGCTSELLAGNLAS